MIYDWLSMVKGNNMPAILINPDNRHKPVYNKMIQLYDHTIRRSEVQILSTGQIAFADSTKQNPVTGLYDVIISSII